MRRRRPPAWIAKDDCPGRGRRPAKPKRDNFPSLGFVLSLEAAKRFLGFLHIGESEAPGFDQVGHHGLRAPAEQCQQFVDQLTLRDVAGNRGLEDMEVTHLPRPAYGVFAFQAIDRRLDRGVGRTVLLGEVFLNLTDGGAATRPQSFHDLQLQAGQLGSGHSISYRRMQYYYARSKCQEDFPIVLVEAKIPTNQRGEVDLLPENSFFQGGVGGLGAEPDREQHLGKLWAGDGHLLRTRDGNRCAGGWEVGKYEFIAVFDGIEHGKKTVDVGLQCFGEVGRVVLKRLREAVGELTLADVADEVHDNPLRRINVENRGGIGRLRRDIQPGDIDLDHVFRPQAQAVEGERCRTGLNGVGESNAIERAAVRESRQRDDYDGEQEDDFAHGWLQAGVTTVQGRPSEQRPP